MYHVPYMVNIIVHSVANMWLELVKTLFLCCFSCFHFKAKLSIIIFAEPITVYTRSKEKKTAELTAILSLICVASLGNSNTGELSLTSLTMIVKSEVSLRLSTSST
jgi:hypothetical protein